MGSRAPRGVQMDWLSALMLLAMLFFAAFHITHMASLMSRFINIGFRGG